jgi:ABC-type Fe3+ transport system permease subunit
MAKILKKTVVNDFTACCVSCGALVTDAQRVTAEGKNYCMNCAILAKKPEPALSVPRGIWKWLCYFASFFSPLTGFVIGLIFMSQKDQDSRNFGRHCLVIMCVSIALIVLFVILTLMINIAVLGGGTTGLNIGEGYY